MTTRGSQCAVLLADITGSTQLYETVGDSEAARRICLCIDWMRKTVEDGGGVFVAAKGDDVLATFATADAALTVVEHIMAHSPRSGLSVHAGLHYGAIISTHNDIFGNVVNLTARLAGTANPGEVLFSRDFVMRLSRERAEALRPLNAITFKGMSEPVEVYSLNEDTKKSLKTVRRSTPEQAPDGRLAVVLSFGEIRRLVEAGTSFSLGRSPENDFVLLDPWVSRRHATITVVEGRVQLTDHSSYGTYLMPDGAVELVARRETVTVTGTGRLSPGVSVANPEAAVILFEVVVS